ncbi:A24 family peptidase [Vibrio methylphosphonaticus]|uniref:A24 family peptidase n=1 Tax=Vibrio methylphosphonaticus TaxID=2946866 RepID=UPI00202A182F|nr:prepilin peptidase [Vibrio methylphosphonaticus]MCL9774878.1 prepilin peptidase [Vibrio methylphosphonaticus]
MLYLNILIVFCSILSLSDIFRRKLPNLALILLGVFQLSMLNITNIHITTFLLVLSIGFVLFYFDCIGGGDVKYAAVLSLALPLTRLPEALSYTAYAGGMLIIAYYILYFFSETKKIQHMKLPYGVAISVGFYLAIFDHHSSI